MSKSTRAPHTILSCRVVCVCDSINLWHSCVVFHNRYPHLNVFASVVRISSAGLQNHIHENADNKSHNITTTFSYYFSYLKYLKYANEKKKIHSITIGHSTAATYLHHRSTFCWTILTILLTRLLILFNSNS